jgi:hypothetical protein
MGNKRFAIAAPECGKHSFRFRQTSSSIRTIGILAIPVAANHLNPRMRDQPRGERRR